MQLTSLLPNIGAPVPTDILNLEKLADASPGELLYASIQLAKLAVNQLADATTYHHVPTFRHASGGDWNGFQPAPKKACMTTQETASPPSDSDLDSDLAEESADEPVAPERYYDSLPGMGLMLGHLENVTAAANTLYAGYVHESMSQQPRYFGTPYDATPFRNANQYLSQTRRWSGSKIKKHLGRAALLTHTPGGDPTIASSHPTYPAVAASYTQGRLSAEIADRIVDMRTSLHKYAGDSHAPPGMVDQVMAAFEGVLAETGETVTPEEFTRFKKDWTDQIAHELNADGPSPSQALRKPPDNAIKTKSFPEGGGRIWMDATPEIYTPFKNFMLQMLKADHTPTDVPQDLINLIHPAGYTDQDHGKSADQDGPATQHRAETNDEPASHNESTSDDDFPSFDAVPDNINDLHLNEAQQDQAVSEDAQANTYTTTDLEAMDPMSSGQKISAILIGMFRTMLRMDPAEIGIKKSHGASAQLVIVQDVQTAYRALGIPPLPPDAQRPPGPNGMSPPIIHRPNPNTPHRPEPEVSNDAGHGTAGGEPVAEGKIRFINQLPWTPYRCQALNHGSMHPADAEILSCDSELVAQLWDGPDTVLNQKRTKRLFTVTQRRAILARDRGCQAPGCTTPAVFCDIHHIKDWLAGGNTSVTNAVTLCSHHHAAVHIGKWRIRKHNGLTWFQPAPWLDPYQPLLRNLYWNT